ncbi:MAG TPA: cytochrome c family protein [Bradyrhizobium sp.]|uniref:c-type cytochrome n=1 Tax=Bradyrhizobium sp. TaxID=376 RepID=UPI002B47C511|nr:cytochrome c family protein [Bradyrhizobium sp.]HKO69986.1 cytochrome c family protein [Bradyrhizobium sp.]
MYAIHATALAILACLVITSQSSAAEGNPARGQRVFGACAACHSLQPDQNMTGPSLAGLWDRKAGTLESFSRYSSALKSANVVWNEKTLDDWITDPQQVVPGNQMTFPGVKDAKQRADLLAFLKQATQPGSQIAQQGAPMGGMGGMMGGGQAPNLKKLDASDRVQEITYCKDTYVVTTANGDTHKFWERNLRLKTDASSDGPEKNAPALVAAGMMGDRADVIFAEPGEISAFITVKCG